MNALAELMMIVSSFFSVIIFFWWWYLRSTRLKNEKSKNKEGLNKSDKARKFHRTKRQLK